MNGISLFSGAGGIDLGFERAGIRTVLQAENDPWCLSVLARHWPDVERLTDVRRVGVQPASHDDLKGRMDRGIQAGHDPRLTDGERATQGAPLGADHGVNGSNVNVALVEGRRPHRQNPIDVVFGGFPCQDVSVAGNRAGLGGARSGLWSEFSRVLRELRPTWFCVENVPGLLSSARGRDFGTILSDVDKLGYGVAWAVLDARHFGVPQRRRRVFIVGCLGNADAAAQVLAVCESCGGHPAKGSEAGQGTTCGPDDSVAFTLPSAHRGIETGWNTNHVTPENEPEARAVRARASGYRMDGETETFVVAGALRASDGHHGHSSPRGDGADNLIAFSSKDYGADASLNRSPTLRVGGAGDGGGNPPAISSLAGVRRLTPLECERLMSWPDGWTEFTADGKEIPDSHRYRICGNGVVSTVAEWIGHRVVAVDRMLRQAA